MTTINHFANSLHVPAIYEDNAIQLEGYNLERLFKETKKVVYQRVDQLNNEIDIKVDQLNKVDLENQADFFFKAVKDIQASLNEFTLK